MFKAYTDCVSIWRWDEALIRDGMILTIIRIVVSESGDFTSKYNDRTSIVMRPGRKISRKAFFRLTKFMPVVVGIKDEDTKP